MWDLIFVSMENWDEVWRRNQFLVSGLARRFPKSKILFVGLPRDVSNRLRRGKSAETCQPTFQTVPDLPNVSLTSPLKLLPNSLVWGRKINEAMLRTHIRRAARALGLRAPVLWLNPHSAVHMIGRMGECAVVYDITDDWIEAATSATEMQLIRTQDAELCRRADAVIVCSQKLYDLKSTLTQSLHLVPNGVHASHYSRVLDQNGPRPKQTADWPSPVFGYTGTIHPERVDVGLVEALARTFPQGTVALVGPNLLPPPEAARLSALRNVQLTGPVAYHDLPDYMRIFDVCITPHRMTAFTESLNPIKLWEYLAAGKPIVSTDVAGFRDYPQLVALATTPAEFTAQCRTALHEHGAKASARTAEAGKHTWEARINQVLSILQKVTRQ